MSLLLLLKNWLLGDNPAAASSTATRTVSVEKYQRTTAQYQNRIAHDESPARKAKPV